MAVTTFARGAFHQPPSRPGRLPLHGAHLWRLPPTVPLYYAPPKGHTHDASMEHVPSAQHIAVRVHEGRRNSSQGTSMAPVTTRLCAARTYAKQQAPPARRISIYSQTPSLPTPPSHTQTAPHAQRVSTRCVCAACIHGRDVCDSVAQPTTQAMPTRHRSQIDHTAERHSRVLGDARLRQRHRPLWVDQREAAVRSARVLDVSSQGVMGSA
ncbi:hypothetical protein HYPSUDRAFT_201373 [Hypholoma sublateritium FD-334 SS-4]|uniref:Uncharacterized protein n=1 Tax=Hypholoma sublateritium (strain FD-334 SS-4) TaxID=945553 RepID=A0A0D2NX27_HYPSF|nr:hypothetical protein HYPSUDRAFT_201373 [Hypholoma sublateritium FD-334 SS-4]